MFTTLVQIHSAYSESIAHMCFANSLSPQSWMNIHPSIRERIYELNPTLLQDLQLENLKNFATVRCFHDACKNIGHIPASIARQFLTKLALIIQEDGEIGLLDALLLERLNMN